MTVKSRVKPTIQKSSGIEAILSATVAGAQGRKSHFGRGVLPSRMHSHGPEPRSAVVNDP